MRIENGELRIGVAPVLELLGVFSLLLLLGISTELLLGIAPTELLLGGLLLELGAMELLLGNCTFPSIFQKREVDVSAPNSMRVPLAVALFCNVIAICELALLTIMNCPLDWCWKLHHWELSLLLIAPSTIRVPAVVALFCGISTRLPFWVF